MKNSDRIIVYVVGFILGMLLVSVILSRRAAKEENAVDPWLAHNSAMIEAGADPLPDGVPEAMHKGQIIDFGFLPDEAAPVERVWLLNFKESYPYVRVVENLETGEFQFMAADQISIVLADGVDVTELKPMLDEVGIRLRMFNRKENLAVIGVLSTQIDAVPATIEAVQRWNTLFDSAHADELKFHGE